MNKKRKKEKRNRKSKGSIDLKGGLTILIPVASFLLGSYQLISANLPIDITTLVLFFILWTWSLSTIPNTIPNITFNTYTNLPYIL